jgi:hypothetical protein
MVEVLPAIFWRMGIGNDLPTRRTIASDELQTITATGCADGGEIVVIGPSDRHDLGKATSSSF